MGTANHLPSFSLTGPQNTMMHSVPTGLFFVTLLSLGHCASSPRSGQAPKDAAAAVWVQLVSLSRSDARPTLVKGSTAEIRGSPGLWWVLGEKQLSTYSHTWKPTELAHNDQTNSWNMYDMNTNRWRPTHCQIPEDLANFLQGKEISKRWGTSWIVKLNENPAQSDAPRRAGAL